jgi:hypothetical protein
MRDLHLVLLFFQALLDEACDLLLIFYEQYAHGRLRRQ